MKMAYSLFFLFAFLWTTAISQSINKLNQIGDPRMESESMKYKKWTRLEPSVRFFDKRWTRLEPSVRFFDKR